MSATQHTPGPWKLEVNEKSATVRILGPRGDGNTRPSDGLGDLVAVDCAAEPDAVMFSPMLPEQLANARLIAAAPDMLAELRELVDWLEGNQRSIEGEFLMDDLLAGSRAAIAKAEGRP